MKPCVHVVPTIVHSLKEWNDCIVRYYTALGWEHPSGQTAAVNARWKALFFRAGFASLAMRVQAFIKAELDGAAALCNPALGTIGCQPNLRINAEGT